MAGHNVYVRTPWGPRIYDLVVRGRAQGVLTGIEVKSSRAAFDKFIRDQFCKDWWVNRYGGEIFGEEAGRRLIKGASLRDALKILWEE